MPSYKLRRQGRKNIKTMFKCSQKQKQSSQLLSKIHLIFCCNILELCILSWIMLSTFQFVLELIHTHCFGLQLLFLRFLSLFDSFLIKFTLNTIQEFLNIVNSFINDLLNNIKIVLNVMEVCYDIT